MGSKSIGKCYEMKADILVRLANLLCSKFTFGRDYLRAFLNCFQTNLKNFKLMLIFFLLIADIAEKCVDVCC